MAKLIYSESPIIFDRQPEVPRIFSTSVENVLTQVHHEGFAHLSSDFYFPNSDHAPLEKMQSTYQLLPEDPAPGNRFRAYARYDFLPKEKTFLKQESNEYFQSIQYNYIDGGKVREFHPICDQFLDNILLKTLLAKDIALAQQLDVVNFDSPLELGLHQIRYKAKDTQPAYSSPLWLHRDDEPLVFVHLFNVSDNALGGDNLIATDFKTITHLIRLTNPLETLLLTKKPYHAVTPLGSADKNYAFRDILLVTFMNK